MREISSAEITQAVKKMAMTAACDLEPDILDALLKARDTETGFLAKNAIEMLLANADIASREKMPICQDTGICVLFVSLGQDVHISGDLDDAIQQGVRDGYREGYLRASVCDPLTRKNTGTNTPAIVHVELVPGDSLKLSFLPKGCGSENMSGLTMLPPSAGISGVVEFVTEKVVAAGPNPCPPVVVGVGMGGTFEKAAYLAKKSLLRPVGTPSARQDVAALEKEILAAINARGLGVQGLGGINTALAVHIEVFPSHIASLPVAVNIQCHAHRYNQVVL
ncbi:MAG: fumarate hydratase [Proteobacteria bacterium]|nr:fumarate hydratase [Pseudomonadota bacterium]MBU1710551.1 fumarate hydratase [Pseudomonadota bacterium]